VLLIEVMLANALKKNWVGTWWLLHYA
jgi:hypothetical protein